MLNFVLALKSLRTIYEKANLKILNQKIYYQKKSLATPNYFPIYLVNAESMESCFVCSETGFISEQLCMKTLVVVADAEE